MTVEKSFKPTTKPLETYERFVHVKTKDFLKALQLLLPTAKSFTMDWSETGNEKEYQHFEDEQELQ